MAIKKIHGAADSLLFFPWLVKKGLIFCFLLFFNALI